MAALLCLLLRLLFPVVRIVWTTHRLPDGSDGNADGNDGGRR
ncbi:hypothetical protein RKD39_003224 [Streptomyces albogriseolus]